MQVTNVEITEITLKKQYIVVKYSATTIIYHIAILIVIAEIRCEINISTSHVRIFQMVYFSITSKQRLVASAYRNYEIFTQELRL